MGDGGRHHLEPDDAASLKVGGLVVLHQEAQVVEQEPVPVLPVPYRKSVASLPAGRCCKDLVRRSERYGGGDVPFAIEKFTRAA